MNRMYNRKYQSIIRFCSSIVICSLLLLSLTPQTYARSASSLPLPGRVLCVTPEGGTYADCDAVFTNIQAAVDAATPFLDEVRIAGAEYTHETLTNTVSQLVYVNKSLKIEGGFSKDDWQRSKPLINKTILNAQGHGRVMFLDGGQLPIAVTIKGLHIVSGNAPLAENDQTKGGGIFVVGANARIARNIIMDNEAELGGAIYAAASVVTLRRNYIAHNRAQSDAIAAGGGLFLEQSGLRLIHNLIELNSADGATVGAGGGIAADRCIVASAGVNQIRFNQVSSTSVGLGGGGIFANCDVYIYDTVVEGNSVFATHAGHGGGMFLFAQSSVVGSTILYNNEFAHNIVEGDSTKSSGAGIYITENGTLNEPIYLLHNQIKDNYVSGFESTADSRGGGIFMNKSIAVVHQNALSRNRVSGYEGGISIGGGLYMNHSAALLNKNQIYANETSGTLAGGSGLAALFSAVAMRDNLLSDNWSHGDVLDGGVGGYFLESAIQAENTVVQRNSGGDLGSGLLLDGHERLEMNFYHTTVRQNSDMYYLVAPEYPDYQSSGIGVWDASATFVNSIVSDEYSGISAHNDSLIKIQGVLWHNNQADATGDGMIALSQSFVGDPRFNGYTDASFDVPTPLDFRIMPGSKAIDKGIVTHVQHDIEGDLRDEMPDLGADEANLLFPIPVPIDPVNPVPAPPVDPYPIEPIAPGPILPGDPALIPSGDLEWVFGQLEADSIDEPALPPTAPPVELPAKDLLPAMPDETHTPDEEMGTDPSLLGPGIGQEETVTVPFTKSAETPVLELIVEEFIPEDEGETPGQSATGEEAPTDGDGTATEGEPTPAANQPDGTENDPASSDPNTIGGTTGGEAGANQDERFSPVSREAQKIYLPSVNFGK